MPACRDCKFYKQMDDTVGDCFGVEVSGEQVPGKCISAKRLMIT